MKDELILKKFSVRVRELREQQGLTQQQLAELADLEYKYIQRIEGKNPPSIGLVKLIRLIQALKIPASKFFTFINEQTA